MSSSANPLILMQAQLAGDLRKLEALYSQRQRAQHRLRDRLNWLKSTEERLARAGVNQQIGNGAGQPGQKWAQSLRRRREGGIAGKMYRQEGGQVCVGQFHFISCPRGAKMKFEKRIKRLADFCEKLGVIGIGLGVYQQVWPVLYAGMIFTIVSFLLTQED